jgi:hypothetical protein
LLSIAAYRSFNKRRELDPNVIQRKAMKELKRRHSLQPPRVEVTVSEDDEESPSKEAAAPQMLTRPGQAAFLPSANRQIASAPKVRPGIKGPTGLLGNRAGFSNAASFLRGRIAKRRPM